MAEDDGIEGLLGGEPEERGREGATIGAGADAVALALAMQAIAENPDLSRTASEYLSEQKHLVQLQIKHFDEERRLAIAAAKRKRYADRIRNCLSTCFALIVVALVAAIARMTIEAMNDHALVVESFTVPPDLEARGASAQSLAADLVSRLAAIRATANRNSFNYSEEVRATEARTLKVEIPQTGVSLDELERFVHRWLGHQSVMNGHVREQANGLISLSLHIAGLEGIEVTGPKTELDRLSQEAAEKAFATFDPNNFAIYLASSGRGPEALRAMENYVQSAELMAKSPRDRADAYSLLGGMDPQLRRALSRALIAIDLDPRVGIGWTEAARASAELGHDQNAADFYRKVLSTKADDQAPEQRAGYSAVIREARLAIETATGDYAAVDAENGASYRSRPTNDQYAASAHTAAALHDEPRSRQQLAHALAAGPVDLAVLNARWYVNAAAGDWRDAVSDAKALIADAEAKKAAAPDADWAGKYELVLQTTYRPWLALAQFMNGDAAAAAALAAQSPVDCYLCARVRARIAAADDVSGEHGFAEAVRQAPSLPMAYWEWGQALLARGDLTGAAKQFAVAHEKGPRFADPLKDWGDVLQKQGRSREALTRYDEALKYAPNWAALKGARAIAAGAL